MEQSGERVRVAGQGSNWLIVQMGKGAWLGRTAVECRHLQRYLSLP